MHQKKLFPLHVLIESDWNLKGNQRRTSDGRARVLIESDWNLKDDGMPELRSERHVLIESDWNLKLHFRYRLMRKTDRINRIRLEFKGN